MLCPLSLPCFPSLSHMSAEEAHARFISLLPAFRIAEKRRQVNEKWKEIWYIFHKNGRKKRPMTLRSEKLLDSTDWKILRELQRDARLSFNALGRRVGLSSPSTAERVHKLEEAGI